MASADDEPEWIDDYRLDHRPEVLTEAQAEQPRRYQYPDRARDQPFPCHRSAYSNSMSRGRQDQGNYATFHGEGVKQHVLLAERSPQDNQWKDDGRSVRYPAEPVRRGSDRHQCPADCSDSENPEVDLH